MLDSGYVFGGPGFWFVGCRLSGLGQARCFMRGIYLRGTVAVSLQGTLQHATRGKQAFRIHPRADFLSNRKSSCLQTLTVRIKSAAANLGRSNEAFAVEIQLNGAIFAEECRQRNAQEEYCLQNHNVQELQ